MRRKHDSKTAPAETLIDRLRGSNDWRAERNELARIVYADPRQALDLAAAFDEAQVSEGFDVAIDSMRSSLLDLVGSLASTDATDVAVALSSNPSTAHPSRGDRAELRDRGATQVVGMRSPEEVRRFLDRAGWAQAV